ncbi:hypothetical protein [Streptomyces canarius]
MATVLLLFPYSDYFRSSEPEQFAVVSLSAQFTANGDFSASHGQTGIDMARDQGFSQDVLGPVLFAVPRSV